MISRPVRTTVRPARDTIRAALVVVALAVLGLAPQALAPVADAASPTLAGVELSPPAAADEHGAGLGDFPTSVSCGADGSCAAVGSFTPASDDTTGTNIRANVETGGTWGAGTVLSLPSDAGTRPDKVTAATLGDVACPAAGQCLAVGGFSATAPAKCGGDVGEALAESLTGGSWTASEDHAPGDPCNRVTATKVACASTSWCTAIGYEYDDAGQIFEWMGTGDVAGLDTSATVPTPTSSTGAVASEGDLACASAVELCIATGIDASSGESNLPPNFVLVGTDGHWGRSQSIPLPATGDTDGILENVACSPNHCYGVGSFTDPNGNQEGLVVSTDGGSAWKAVTPAPGDFVDIGCGEKGCAALDFAGCSAEPCSLPDFSDQSGSWRPVSGPGSSNTLYRCSRSGPCFGRGTGADVYTLDGGVSSVVSQVRMPGDCASEDDAACGDNSYAPSTCAATQCTWVQPYQTTDDDAAAAAFTMSTPTTTTPSTARPRVSVVCTPDPARTGSRITCTVTVANPLADSVTRPTGQVRIGTGAAADPACTLTPAGSGQSTCQVAFDAPEAGSATIAARYSGDARFAAATASTTEVVQAPSSPAATIGGAHATGSTATLTASCPAGGGGCRLVATMTTRAAGSGRRPVVATPERRTRKVVVGSLHAVVGAGRHSTLRVRLNHTGRRLLATKGRVVVTLQVRSDPTSGRSEVLTTRTLTFRHR